jgi:predicted enzyme related to lactoylglutathione lyase
MITGTHALIYTRQADAVRDFFREVLELPSVDTGGGWLIFALPPAELGVHPAESETRHELTLMCDDIEATVASLKVKGVEFLSAIEDQGWGLVTNLRLPDGSALMLYEPKHPSPAAAV